MNQKRLLSCGLFTLAASFAFAAQKPNIVLILADDMGAGDVSAINENSKIKTPNIDYLVNNGVNFRDGHTASSVSTPTRYSIVTGRYCWRSTKKDGVLMGTSAPIIPTDRSTIASVMKRGGYTTACIGKWHLGWNWAKGKGKGSAIDFTKRVTGGPSELGFDYFFGFCGSLDMAPYVWVENDMATAVPTKSTVNNDAYGYWRNGLTSDDFVHEKALGDIAQRGADYITKESKEKQPYFLYLPFPAPHTPILPTKEFQGKSGLNPYGDYVLTVDHYVGMVVDAVKKSGEADNTIIVFMPDNGCSNRANFKVLAKKGHNPSYLYKGWKASISDGGHRVPFVVYSPKLFKAHQVEQTVCSTDYMATFAAIAGVKMNDNEGEDSYNILPLLKNTKEAKPIREATVHHSSKGDFAIRKGDWKLIMAIPSEVLKGQKSPIKIPEGTKPILSLYNIKEDIGEKKNVVKQHPEVVKELQKLMIKYVEDGRSTPGAPQKNDGVATGIIVGAKG